MTKQEIVKVLEQWPDDAQVELAIAVNLHAEDPVMEEKIWLEIAMVEESNLSPIDDKHCLIFGGKITGGIKWP